MVTHMKFRTEINIPKSKIQFEHSDKVLTIGSCFAENISKYFTHYKFNILENPFGVLYNPVSIYNSLMFAIQEKQFKEEDLIFDQSEYHSFFHHSDFSHHDANKCLNNINDKLLITHEYLKECDKLIISLGTSYVYKHNDSELIVSNCHKIPQSEFERFRLTIKDVKEYLQEIVDQLKSYNKDLKIIFTISPVRHWKDGAVDNQLSKSILLLAVNEVVNQSKNCEYFPSYEIMMDDLRDYRFYTEDLIHPNKIAVDYIWNKFSENHFSKNCCEVMNEVHKIVQAANHKPRNTQSDLHQKFLRKNLEQIKNLTGKYPYLNFDTEEKEMKSLITQK